MSDHLVIRQLRAIRDLVDNTLELLGDEGDPVETGPCAHPKEKRRPAGVMGDPERVMCMQCQTFVGSAVPSAPEEA